MKEHRLFAALLAAILTITSAVRVHAQVPASTSWGRLDPLSSQTLPSTGGAAQTNVSARAIAGAKTDEDACTTVQADPGMVIFVPDPLGFAPGGGADQFSSPPPELKPKNPVIKDCERGRIIMRVENRRFYAYHVGDEIPISIKILVDDSVQLNFASLKQDVIGFDGSDFQLIPVRQVDIASRPDPHRPHTILYGIELKVQTFVTKPMIAFNLDLQYAVDVPPGVKQPNWRILTTPDFVITTTPVVVDNDDEPLEGDLKPDVIRQSWLGWPLTTAGLFMTIWFGFLRRLVVRFNRKRPGRIVPPNEIAWDVFAKVFSDAREYGDFNSNYLRKIDTALRKYLAQTSKMKIEALTIKELSAIMAEDPRLPDIISVLDTCESVLYAPADQPLELTLQQIGKLQADLIRIVPQPELDD